MQTALLYFCLAGLAAALPVLLGIWLWRIDSHPVLEAVSRLRRLPVAARLVLVAFVAQLIVYGSTKTNGNGYVEGGVTNGNGYGEGGLTNGPSALPPPLMMLAGEMPTVFGFTSNQFAAGFVLSHVGFGDPCGFEMPPSASAVEDWLLRGAADDWRPGPPSSLVAGQTVVFADGRIQDGVRNPSQVYAPLHAPLGVVPEANWGLVAGTNAQSRVWHMTTASNSVVVTWEDVLLGRDTNSPVSVQAEFFENGNFAYRYDLKSVECRIESGELDASVLTNIVIGASSGGMPFQMPLADIVTNASLSIFNSPFSIFFHALSGEDALVADRDGDGVSTYDEIFVHHTDPGLLDSDGDGICDGDEIAQSLDPLVPSVSNEALLARLGDFQTNLQYAAAYVAATNELVGYRLWDSFAATLPAGATNLVYERTVRIDCRGGWQHYYLSSRPDAAGGWSLSGLELEWEDSCGESGTAAASPVADSLHLPLSTNGPSSVTFRLRATATDLRSVNPVYLVGYAPSVSIEGGRKVSAAGIGELEVFTGGSGSSIGVSVDRSRRPCKAPPTSRELAMDGLADLEARTGGELRYEGNAYGGLIVATGAGVYQLPDVAVSGADQAPPMRGPRRGVDSHYLVVLAPWVRYGDDHCAGRGLGWDEDGGYFVEYEYPLDSGCLVREWHRGEGGEWICSCE
ncbi:MAG: hypothetical protein IKO55_18900, partial [Kiritimatiellae bacterium]|nr:hypothetical protein [Kiritimatiellia bacterium]